MEQEVEENAAKEEQLHSKVQAAQEQQAENDAFWEEWSFDKAHAPGSHSSGDGDLEVASEAAATGPYKVSTRASKLSVLKLQALHQE